MSEGFRCENEEEIVKKIPLVYEYLSHVLIDKKKFSTLKAQLKQYLVTISVLKEPDLCTSNVVKDNVFISTVHKAKGLEFDNVIVTNVGEGIYPFFLNRYDKKKGQEDARKLYVAITRAKRTVCLICLDTICTATPLTFLLLLRKFLSTLRAMKWKIFNQRSLVTKRDAPLASKTTL